ncbi:hypothetical protein CI109_103615 [Kwoniella shandongensis]|uniref:RNA-dependent RNA polymerase n=1 Tax=Kwoniella shandongensis TaxID=1734106 RepID=A0AAJ8LJN8_9TREE
MASFQPYTHHNSPFSSFDIPRLLGSLDLGGVNLRNPYGRSDVRPGKTANNRETSDVARFQFWPDAIAMGSLNGRIFTQMFGAPCVKGEDHKTHHGLSFIAFDLRRELLVIKAEMKLPPMVKNQLPPALAPLDAELSFDDITSHGIHIRAEPVHMGIGQNGMVTSELRVTVTVSCRRPPKFYTVFEANDQLLQGRNGKTPYRRRATMMDFASSGVSERDAGPVKAIPEGPCAYPTFWNTYRWVLNMSRDQYAKLLGCAASIRALAEKDPDMDLIDANSRLRWRTEFLDGEGIKSIYSPPDLSGVRFSSRTLIEGLIAHGILRPADTGALVGALQKVAIVSAFQDRILESLYSEERIRDVNALIPERAAFLRRKSPQTLSHLVLIRTVLVTPTRLLVGPPQQEPSNSVTRKYADKLDGIIRVQFADEEDRLFRLNKNHTMIDGVALRQWMGTVADTVVAKHSARMGLPFSTSRIVEMKIVMGSKLPDVERNGFTFTDGVAVAGKEVLRQAALALGEKRGINLTPSAIQFRLGGAKGVLADWPHLAKPYEVRLRPSLIKFDSKLSDLNVIRIAKYQVAFLNRQFINIMCANGVPKDLIISIFKDSVDHIKGLRGRVESSSMTEEDHRLVSACSEFPLAQLIKAGFHKNPLILDVAEIIECRALQDLKWRARVRLPGGVFLIGIADETGLLEEGQLFCQFQESEDSEPRIVVNEVLICRAPALHPGDVRRAWAVDRPELRHLKNVIVLNTKGYRDLPNMLGGGDLDGDDYTLIWDQRFVEPLRMYEPMDYKAPPPKTVLRVTQTDLNENFVQYITNDVLGQVDNCHLALSDSEEKGPFDEKCLRLSTIHSTAYVPTSSHGKTTTCLMFHSCSVDFAKTGQAAVLDPDLRPQLWPDFMDKDDVKKVYTSKKILGDLFRMVQPDPHFSPSDIRQMEYPSDPRITRYPLHKSLLDRLKPIKANFERDLQYDMRRYRVFEPEIPSGIAIRNKRRKRARDQNLNEPLRDSYEILVQTARETAMAAVANVTFNTRLTPAQMVARHCYALTFEKEHVEAWEEQLTHGGWHGASNDIEDDEQEDIRPKPLVSFAWCFWQELVQIVGLSNSDLL